MHMLLLGSCAQVLKSPKITAQQKMEIQARVRAFNTCDFSTKLIHHLLDATSQMSFLNDREKEVVFQGMYFHLHDLIICETILFRCWRSKCTISTSLNHAKNL